MTREKFKVKVRKKKFFLNHVLMKFFHSRKKSIYFFFQINYNCLYELYHVDDSFINTSFIYHLMKLILTSGAFIFIARSIALHYMRALSLLWKMTPQALKSYNLHTFTFCVYGIGSTLTVGHYMSSKRVRVCSFILIMSSRLRLYVNSFQSSAASSFMRPVILR
jgi:hypothetical protein